MTPAEKGRALALEIDRRCRAETARVASERAPAKPAPTDHVAEALALLAERQADRQACSAVTDPSKCPPSPAPGALRDAAIAAHGDGPLEREGVTAEMPALTFPGVRTPSR